MPDITILPLDRLVADAVMLADPDAYAHRGVIWGTDGGRCCPVGWEDCSQPVFVDRVTGGYDYGDRGGPGHQWCADHCRHHMAPPEKEEEDEGDDSRQIGFFFTYSQKETGK